MSSLLEGVKVVALERVIAVPAATAILADWGAEVIKVEHPGEGDWFRNVQAAGVSFAGLDRHPWFELLNRGKKSIALDVGKEGGRKALLQLLAEADVFAASLLPSSLKGMELDYEALCRLNPRLIYATVTGYGHEGPERDRPGFDIAAFWARSGIMAYLGEPEAPPVLSAYGMGDLVTSLPLAGAIMAALYERERSGRGQAVTTNLYQTGVWAMGLLVQARLAGAALVPRISRRTMANPLRNCYRCADGRWLIINAPLERDWAPFCRALGHPKVEEDPRFATLEGRLENREALIQLLDEAFAGRPITEWAQRLARERLVWEKVRTVDEVVEDDQARCNDFFARVEQPSGPWETLASPIRLSRSPARPQGPAPELGQHTEEVLLALGYSWEEIIRLKEEGAIL